MYLGLTIIAMAAIAFALAVAGTYLLFGLAISMLVASMLLFACAVLLRSGMVPNEQE